MGQSPSTNRAVFQSKESVNVVLTDQVFERLTKNPLLMKDVRPEPERERLSNVYDPEDVEVETVDAIADQESEFTQNKNYWKKRLEDLQQVHEKIKLVLETEKQRGIKDVEGTLTKVDAGKGERPCVENHGEVVECFKSNTGEPLNCRKQVLNFMSCLNSKMSEKLSPEIKTNIPTSESPEIQTNTPTSESPQIQTNTPTSESPKIQTNTPTSESPKTPTNTPTSESPKIQTNTPTSESPKNTE